MFSINIYMTIRWIIADAVLAYWIVYFYKKNKYNDYYDMEFVMCIFFFIVVTFLIWLNLVDFN